MTIPYWVTPANLATLNSVTTDLNQTPLEINYHSDTTATVTLLNGTFPTGLTWQTNSNNTIIVSGTLEVGTYSWTWRITNRSAVSDRTFYLTVISDAATTVDWTGQTTFLGYASAARQTQYHVQANTNTTKSISYYLIPPLDNTGLPDGMTIDILNGIISFQPANNIDQVTDVTFTVRAQVDSTSIDQLFHIIQTPIVFEPIWQTPANTVLAVIKSGEFFEYQLSAFNPNIDTLSYRLASAFPHPSTLLLTTTGLIHGRVPRVTQITDYTVGITVSNNTASVTNYIKFKVLPNIDASLVFNSNISDLGTYEHGQLVVLDISAVSTRTPNLTYSIIGGTLPPGLRLDSFNGVIVGFLEFQPVDHSYAWEISATDGTAQITQRYSVRILSQGVERLDVTIPLMGDIKDRWNTAKQLLVDTFVVEPFSQVLPIDYSHPRLNLISGLNPGWINPDQFETNIRQQLIPAQYTFANVSNVEIGTNQQIYISVRDPQLTANDTADFKNTHITVPSLTNLRKYIEDYYAFESNGSGTAASLVPLTDPSGAIANVSVVVPGANYLFVPDLVVIGTGTGAKITGNLAIQTNSLISITGNWSIGDQVIIDVGEFDQPAIIEYDTANNIPNFKIQQSGNYQKFPYGPQNIYNSTTGHATVLFSLGLANIGIVNPGTGYFTNTQIEIKNTEILDPGLTVWQPAIPMAIVENTSMPRVLANEKTNALSGLIGYQFEIDYLLLNYQGKLWTGSSRLDQNLTLMDGNSTTFDDYLEPSNTVFDQTKTTWDKNSTFFDYKKEPIVQYTANATVFEASLACYTREPTQIASHTLIQKLIK